MEIISAQREIRFLQDPSLCTVDIQRRVGRGWVLRGRRVLYVCVCGQAISLSKGLVTCKGVLKRCNELQR